MPRRKAHDGLGAWRCPIKPPARGMRCRRSVWWSQALGRGRCSPIWSYRLRDDAVQTGSWQAWMPSAAQQSRRAESAVGCRRTPFAAPRCRLCWLVGVWLLELAGCWYPSSPRSSATGRCRSLLGGAAVSSLCPRPPPRRRRPRPAKARSSPATGADPRPPGRVEELHDERLRQERNDHARLAAARDGGHAGAGGAPRGER